MLRFICVHLTRRLLPAAVPLLLLTGCWSSSEQFIVTDVRNGIVSLNEFSSRGATGRYLGSLQPIKASHPILLSPERVAQILSGIQIGIIPNDSSGETKVIKAGPLFSAAEVAGLAQGITTALAQADANHYVKFQVGTDPEATDGALYIDGPAVRFTLNHYRSTLRRRDEALGIYALSFVPPSAQMSMVKVLNWIDGDASNPHLAVDYGKIPPDPDVKNRLASPAVERQPAKPAGPVDQQDMRAIMERQAQELNAVKEELESLKRQLGNRGSSSPTPP